MTSDAEQRPWREQITDADRRMALSYGKLAAADVKRLADVIALYAWWNRRMQRKGSGARNRVRVITYDRVRRLSQLLQAFERGQPPMGADEIAGCVLLYSQSEWQQRKNAWMTAEHFFTAGRIGVWLDKLLQQREQGTGNREQESKDPRVAKLEADIAERMRITTENDGLKRHFAALSAEAQNALRLDALEELLALGRPRLRVTEWEIRQQVGVIMKRRGAEAGTAEACTVDRRPGEEACPS